MLSRERDGGTGEEGGSSGKAPVWRRRAVGRLARIRGGRARGAAASHGTEANRIRGVGARAHVEQRAGGGGRWRNGFIGGARHGSGVAARGSGHQQADPVGGAKCGAAADPRRHARGAEASGAGRRGRRGSDRIWAGAERGGCCCFMKTTTGLGVGLASVVAAPGREERTSRGRQRRKLRRLLLVSDREEEDEPKL